MEPVTDEFDYANLLDRAPGAFVSVAARLLPGVARVQAQKQPFAADWRAHNAAAVRAGREPGADPLWVALGDSMTQGIGAPDYRHGWVGQLADRMAAAGRPHRVVNLAATGARAQDVLDRQLPALADLRPAMISLMIGSNDMMRREFRGALPDRFAELLDRLPAGTFVAELPGNRPAEREVNQLVRQAALARGIVPVDMRHGSWRGKLAEDHFHPNEHGYADMAESFAAVVLSG